MKINYMKNYRDCYTVTDFDCAKAVKSEYKGYNFEEDARIALNCYKSVKNNVFYGDADILKLEAEIVTDNFVDYNALCKYSGRMNIWLKITAFSDNSFIILEIPITDIWNMSGEASDFSRAYIREFKEIP